MTEPRASLWQRWVIRPVIQQLTQGVSPSKIAQAIAYGMTLGVFPILGSTTLLTVLVGVPLRLNQPILQAFKTLTYPMQWVSLLGFYHTGEWLFKAPHVSIHIPTMMTRFFAEPGPFFKDYGMTALYGITVWCLLAPVIGLIIYFVTKLLVEKLASLKNSRLIPASP
jgi:uncharacterized protein (DUF2062 family)